jgi:hypothetical protein
MNTPTTLEKYVMDPLSYSQYSCLNPTQTAEVLQTTLDGNDHNTVLGMLENTLLNNAYTLEDKTRLVNTLDDLTTKKEYRNIGIMLKRQLGSVRVTEYMVSHYIQRHFLIELRQHKQFMRIRPYIKNNKSFINAVYDDIQREKKAKIQAQQVELVRIPVYVSKYNASQDRDEELRNVLNQIGKNVSVGAILGRVKHLINNTPDTAARKEILHELLRHTVTDNTYLYNRLNTQFSDLL